MLNKAPSLQKRSPHPAPTSASFPPLPMTAAWTPPALELIEALHERYLHEIVIACNICPFAQRSMQQGRVKRLWWTQPSSEHNCTQIAKRLASTVADSDLEIVLLSFVLPPDDPHQDPGAFEAWHKTFRHALEAIQLDDQWYSVCFHPKAGDPEHSRKTPSSFVPLLRRTPDPVIQCVRVSTLEQVREKAQAQAQAQLIETLKAKDPSLAIMAQSCVMTDSQLSVNIANKNHESWAQDPGWSDFYARLESILSARRELERRA